MTPLEIADALQTHGCVSVPWSDWTKELRAVFRAAVGVDGYRTVNVEGERRRIVFTVDWLQRHATRVGQYACSVCGTDAALHPFEACDGGVWMLREDHLRPGEMPNTVVS